MPAVLSYPGVYIEELPSGVRTITGVATSITAFIGRALRGPVDEPVRIQSVAEFERVFGGLWTQSTLGHAVLQFFQNGGGDALIVRVIKAGAKAAKKAGGVGLAAASPGEWGNDVTFSVKTVPSVPGGLFNLTVNDGAAGVEIFLNLSLDPDNPRYITKVLEDESSLVRVDTGANALSASASDTNPNNLPKLTGGGDGSDIGDNDIWTLALEASKSGIWALEKADIFNLLCIPPLLAAGDLTDIGITTKDAATRYCKQRRAIFVIDPSTKWKTPANVTSAVDTFAPPSANAALYFPMLRAPDPLRDGQIGDFAPCGAVAGVMARTDVTRGVWKAPAGIEATLKGTVGLTVKLTDGENGVLNPLGVNCLRSFPVIGRVVWGARTRNGADQLADQWKYVPVRRLALFLEESLYRGTQWVVFEPNDEPLWAQIRLNIGAFMHNLFRQGAFQGMTPREAYFVACDKTTTTQNDIDRGIVNIVVGFAPLKPAEFVVIKIQQIAGQIET